MNRKLLNGKPIIVFIVLSVILLPACYKKPSELTIDAPKSLQILDRPRAGLTPPFTYSNGNIDEGCVFVNDKKIKWSNAGNELAGEFERNLASSFDAMFKTKIAGKLSLTTNIAISNLNKLHYTVKAHGIEVARVNFTDTDFKISETCLQYLASFDKNDAKLATEAFRADSVVITFSDSLDNSLQSALELELSKEYQLKIEAARKLNGSVDYTVSGDDLVFGYYPVSFTVEYFSYDKPLELKIPVGEQIDVNKAWLSSVSIEEVGDDRTYLIRMNPKVGEQRLARLSVLEQKNIEIDKHQKISVNLSKIENSFAYIKLSGFNIKSQ